MARTLVPTQLATNVTRGQVITPAPRVEIHADGVLDEAIVDGEVTVALANPAGATLSGTLTKAPVGGVAVFDDLTVDVPGSYELIAECDEASLVRSNPGIDPAGAVAHLLFGDNETDPKLETVSGILCSFQFGSFGDPELGPVGQAQRFGQTSGTNLVMPSATEAPVRSLMWAGDWSIMALIRVHTLPQAGTESTIVAVQGFNPLQTPGRCIGKLVFNNSGKAFVWYEGIGTGFPVAATPLPIGDWVLVMARAKNGVVSIGLNGVFESSANKAPPSPGLGSNADVQVGGQTQQSRYIDATFDELWIGPAQSDDWHLQQARRCGVIP